MLVVGDEARAANQAIELRETCRDAEDTSEQVPERTLLLPAEIERPWKAYEQVVWSSGDDGTLAWRVACRAVEGTRDAYHVRVDAVAVRERVARNATRPLHLPGERGR